MLLRRLMSILMLALLACGLADARPSPRQLKVVTWTDIHYGSNEYAPAAWYDAWVAGRAVRPDVIVMTGDMVDNKCSKEAFLERLDVGLAEVGKRLAGVRAPIMMAYGNNDFYANYQTDPEVLAPTIAAFRRHLGRFMYLDDIGNGVSPHRVGGMTWITLNTQIFSPLNKYAGREAQAARTFTFLEKTLKALPAQQPVVLLIHIPPTFDLYDGKLSWHASEVERFASILARHRGPIVILGGHYHRNEVHGFQVPGRGPVPILLAGSVSFKYGNFPNWRSSVWTLGASGGVTRFDWVNHYPAHAAWDRPWTLVSPYATETYARFVERLRDNFQAYLNYMMDLEAHNVSWPKWANDPVTRPRLLEIVAPSPATGTPVPVP